jgi:hypothetical protein
VRKAVTDCYTRRDKDRPFQESANDSGNVRAIARSENRVSNGEKTRIRWRYPLESRGSRYRWQRFRRPCARSHVRGQFAHEHTQRSVRWKLNHRAPNRSPPFPRYRNGRSARPTYAGERGCQDRGQSMVARNPPTQATGGPDEMSNCIRCSVSAAIPSTEPVLTSSGSARRERRERG